jgi:large subunit ribosomal protein L3
MANSNIGLVGRKLGMTQFFNADGDVVPCTVIQAGPNPIIQVKTSSTKDGYNALQLGFGTQKEQRLTKAQLAHFAKANVGTPAHVAEIRVTEADAAKYTAGETLTVDLFTVGEKVDVTGKSKGRGYTGVMKRWHFKGFIRTHGTHEYFRHGGSIGTRLTPGMTLKGKHMGGRTGFTQTTIQNLVVAKIDAEQNLIFVRGGVPGPNGTIVKVRKAIKA